MQPNKDTITSLYFSRYEEMTLEYRLHFVSRLYAWNSDSAAARHLTNIRPEVVPETHKARRDALLSIREELIHKDYERDVNDYARRKPFFEAYPDLLLLHNMLFRIRHWLCIFGVDERETLYEILPKETIEGLLQTIQNDTPAMRALSTYAVNSLYLYEKLYETEIVDIAAIVSLASTYDRSNPSDVQMLIYLYTHCILGETLFYYQPIGRNIETYRSMLRDLESLIADSYETITLDNKFEFLVCAKICEFETIIQERINHEASLSVNSDGFIVDTVNKAINPVKQTFMMSEHRNVLFIMSRTKPQFNRTTIS